MGLDVTSGGLIESRLLDRMLDRPAEFLPVPEDDDAYFEWLKHPRGGGYHFAVRTGDGWWVGIMPLAFHWTMHVGLMSNRTGHEDKFCYQTFEMAADALTDWAVRDFKGLPMGWHRRPSTGQRRPGGDPTKEYIAY